MKLITTSTWDQALWDKAAPIYEQAFPEHGRKPPRVIRSALERRIAHLHLYVTEDDHPIGMALTSRIEPLNALLIDYLAILPELQGLGKGKDFLETISLWAVHSFEYQGLLIEIEAESTPMNQARLRFWERCGFQATDYVHRYIWVPETYRAMVLSFNAKNALPKDGKALFKFITRFHEKAYRGS